MNVRASVAHLIRLSTVSRNLNKNKELRLYTRWAHRRPARVIIPEASTGIKRIEPQNLDNIIELENYEIDEQTPPQTKNKQFVKNVPTKDKKFAQKVQMPALFNMNELDRKTHFKSKTETNAKKQQVTYAKNEILKTTFDHNGDYVYSKMHNNDSIIGTLMLTVKSKKLRDRKEFILVEGKRLIKDALLAGCDLKYLLFSRISDLDFVKDYLPVDNTNLYKLAYKDLQLWSDLTTCPGIMGIFKTPKVTDIAIKNALLPLIVICDNIREPGNLGAILRASIAAGANKIILTKGCVDLWEPKVLRSSCGAHFRFPVHRNVDWTTIRQELPAEKSLFLADNNTVSADQKSDAENNLKNLCSNVPVLPYFAVNYNDCKLMVLIIGGETMGLSEESYKLASECQGIRLNVPLTNDIESLNTGTALGIIAFEIKRQLLINKV